MNSNHGEYLNFKFNFLIELPQNGRARRGNREAQYQEGQDAILARARAVHRGREGPRHLPRHDDFNHQGATNGPHQIPRRSTQEARE